MKVKLLRDHLEDKKGDVIDVTPERANYFKLIGLVAGEGKPYSENKEDGSTREKKEVKAKSDTKEKNSKAGPNAKKK